MNISAITSSASITSAPGVQAGQVPTDSDDDDSRVHKPHRGGHMHDELTQALQSLGLTVPQASGAAATAAPGSDSASATGSTASASQVKDDLHQFMHALFQAVKGESSTPASTDGSSGDPQSSFASGLSALIAQVGSGSAPAGLQDAFSRLAADLQGSPTTATASTDTSGADASGTGTGSSATSPTLQALLTHLQQDLGYGSSSSPSAVGNAVCEKA